MYAAYQHRSLVLSLAIASFALVFTTFVVFEVPGLGIAHLFYLPVAALALTGGVRRGILAGGIAVALFLAVFIPIAAYVVFRLPFRFPPEGMIVSPSLVFGFNNAVAIAGVVLLLAVLTVFQLRRRPDAPGRPVPEPWFYEDEEIAPRGLGNEFSCAVNFFDIAPFIACLFVSCPPRSVLEVVPWRGAWAPKPVQPARADAGQA